MRIIRLIALISTMFGFMAAVPPAAAQKIETRDGVRIVHNRGAWGETPEITLEKVRTLGDIEAVDDTVTFYMPQDITLDGDGNLYVLDTGNHRIQKFSPGGEYLATLGRNGQGPGEFNYPCSLDTDGGNGFIVLSPYSNRIQFLDRDGRETGGLTLTDSLTACLRRFGEERLLAAARRRTPIPGDDDHMNGLDPLMQIMNRQCEVLKTFGEPRDFKHGMVNTKANQVAFAVGPEGNIHLTFLHLNRVEKYSPGGEILWRADRKLKYKSDKPLDKGKIETKGKSGVWIQGARMNRCSEAVAVDDRGRVWVITLDRQLEEEERAGTSISISSGAGGNTVSMSARGGDEITETDAYRLDVFAPDGILLGIIPLDHFADLLLVRGDRLIILDKLRRMQVHEYRIRESGAR